MITLTVLFLATLFLAYSNGANDNFKGVATVMLATITGFPVSTTHGDFDVVAVDVAVVS